jgi:hypothetical protein
MFPFLKLQYSRNRAHNPWFSHSDGYPEQMSTGTPEYFEEEPQGSQRNPARNLLSIAFSASASTRPSSGVELDQISV